MTILLKISAARASIRGFRDSKLLARKRLLAIQGYSILSYKAQESNHERVCYWQKIPQWKDVSEGKFLNYSWQVILAKEQDNVLTCYQG
jgi:hypothetical protein